MNRVRREDGIALLIVLLLMAAGTVLGLAAISLSSLDLRMAGFHRNINESMYAAEAGAKMTKELIRWIIKERPSIDTDWPSEYENVVTSKSVYDRVFQDTLSDPYNLEKFDPEIKLQLGDRTVEIDLERLGHSFIAGGGVEFGAGYEGLGSGSESGGVKIHYLIDAKGSKGIFQRRVEEIYLKVTNLGG